MATLPGMEMRPDVPICYTHVFDGSLAPNQFNLVALCFLLCKMNTSDLPQTLSRRRSPFNLHYNSPFSIASIMSSVE